MKQMEKHDREPEPTRTGSWMVVLGKDAHRLAKRLKGGRVVTWRRQGTCD